MRRVSKYIGWVNGQTCHFWVRSKLDVIHIFCQCDFSQMLHLIVVLPLATANPLPVECTLGDVRLTNGSSHLEGRVEVCFGNLWGTICHNSWDNRDAGVICKQLFNSSFGRLILTVYVLLVLMSVFATTFRWSCHQWIQIWCWWHANCHWKPQLQWHWGQSNQLLHYLIRQQYQK